MPADGDVTLEPSRIRATGFSTSFRGYDTHEVRRFLERLASALEAAEQEASADESSLVRVPSEDQLADLRHELERRDATVAELQGRLAAHQAELAEASVFDEDRAAELLGRETTRVLEAARRAAAELLRKAQTDAEQVRATAEELRTTTEAEAAKQRSRAEADVAQLRAEAEEATAALRAEATAEAERLRTEAAEVLAVRTAEADEVRDRLVAEADQIRVEAAAAAEAAVEAAREQGRQLIAEARSVRERVLSDLVRRRRLSRQQLDQLKAGRDRLARALGEVRRQLDDAVGELAVAVPEARQAAEHVSRRVEGDESVEVAELVRDLDAARTFPASTTVVPDLPVPPAAPAPPEAEAEAGAGAAGAEPPAAGEAAGVEAAGVEAAAADPGAATPAPSPGDPQEPADLDSLFARIRAARSQSADAARGLLAGDAEPGDTPGGEPSVPGNGSAGVGSEPVDPVASVAPGDELVAAGAEAIGLAGPAGVVTDELPEAEPPGPFEARDVALAPVERDLLRRLKRVMADAQSELLDLVGRGRGGVAVASLPSRDEQRQRYARASARAVNAALRAGAEAGGGRIEARYVTGLVDALARHVADPIHNRVEHTVESSGGEREVVLERVRAHYREFRTGELAALVADALAEAYAVGLYRSFDEGAELVWTPDPRVPVGPDCFDNSLAGPVPVAETYPTGHLHPPGAPGCRCLTLAASTTTPADATT
jgi:DivIVA domain-containing protein